MKDLYKLAGLERFEADLETVQRAAQACADPNDRKIIKHILCDPMRKAQYDQALRVADLVLEIDRQADNQNVDSESENQNHSQQEEGELVSSQAAHNEKAGRLLIVYILIFALLFGVTFLRGLYKDDEAVEVPLTSESPEPIGGTVEIIPGPFTLHDYYVTAEALNVRKGPGIHSQVVDQLNRYEELRLELPATEEGWARIVFRDGVSGYVSLDYVEPGSGKAAYRSYCMESAFRPLTGATFDSPHGGNQTLRIEAPANFDVSARLVDAAGDTALLGYVRAGDGFSFGGIPVGSYQLLVGVGHRFSADCALFTETMAERAYSTPLIFDSSLSRSLDVEYQITIRIKESG